MDQVEEVKGKTDIVALVGEYVSLKKAGRNYKGLCPFHGEKTPSFMVNPELQIFKCFGCNTGGDAISFLEKMEGMEFGEALKTLADRVGIKLTSYRPSLQEDAKVKISTINNLAADYFHYLLIRHDLGKEALKYLLGRKIQRVTIDKFRLGFAPEGWDYLYKYLVDKKGFKPEEVELAGLIISKYQHPSTKNQTSTNLQTSKQDGRGYYDRFRNRVMFPLANHRGQVVGFAGRVMPGSDEKSAKYVNTPETLVYHKGEILFGLEITKTDIKTSLKAVVVEGEIDMLAAWQAGVRNVVAIKGSALTTAQVDLLKRYCQELILALDTDLAGDAAARRGIQIAQTSGLVVRVVDAADETVNPGKYKDPGDWAVAEPDEFVKAIEKAVVVYDFYLHSAVKRFGLDSIGKSRIAKELLPIWQAIDDEIVKAHYVNQLAQVLRVEEEAVWRQLGKIPNNKSQITNKLQITNSNNQIKSRREVVEEYLIGLALRADRLEWLADEQVANMFADSFWKRVVKDLKGTGVAGLKPELKSRVQDILFVEEDLTDEEIEKEWATGLAELEEIEIREKITQIQRGGELKKTDLQDLTARLAKLTKFK